MPPPTNSANSSNNPAPAPPSTTSSPTKSPSTSRSAPSNHLSWAVTATSSGRPRDHRQLSGVRSRRPATEEGTHHGLHYPGRTSTAPGRINNANTKEKRTMERSHRIDDPSQGTPDEEHRPAMVHDRDELWIRLHAMPRPLT